ncbi:MAG: GerMN domain-containing protein [Candidatus Korobacteraceae bacterium]
MISRKLQIVIVVLVLAILAMGLYLVHLKRKAESIGTAPITQVLAPPSSGPAQQMTLYLANDADDSLRPVSIASALPADAGERGRLALQTLVARYRRPDSAHPLSVGADVQEVYLLDPASAVVNLNADFSDSHRSGIEVEQLSIFSMVLTLKAQLPQLTRVRFLVDGKSRDTLAGHIDLTGWFDTALVSDASHEQLAKGSE